MVIKRFLIYSPQHLGDKGRKTINFFSILQMARPEAQDQRPKVMGLVSGLSLKLALAPSHYVVNNVLFFT